MTTTLWNCTHEEYHADESKIGSSMLNDLARSPELFRFKHIDQNAKPGGPTDAMKLGTAVHDKVLLGEDPGHLSPSNQWKYEHIIRSWERCHWQWLVEDPDEDLHEVEKAFVREWEGIGWKCKPDILRLAPGGEEILLIDLKTTKDVATGQFSKSIEDFGYYRQAAHYKWVLEPWLLERFEMKIKVNVLYLCFHNAEPFEVRPKEPDPAWIEDGRKSCEQLRKDYVTRLATGNWEAAEAKKIEFCERPKWAKKKEN